MNKSEGCRKPFIFDVVHHPRYLNNKKIIYPKTIYNKKVKNTDWEEYLGALPYDNDPYNPECYSLHTSHYNRLGAEDCFCYSTTTAEALEKGINKSHTALSKKKLINFFSFEDSCSQDAEILPEFSAQDYSTTMQDSYPPPYPYPMQRLAVKRPPWLSTRKIRGEKPDTCATKFYDEGFEDSVKQLICNKAFRANSYDFNRYCYQDGSVPVERKKHKLFKLDY